MRLFDDDRHTDVPSFELHVFDGTPVARGELDLASVPELERWLASLDGQRDAVDLSEVTFFNSRALRVFRKWRQRDPRLRIVRPSNAVARVLTITDTADYLVDGRVTTDSDKGTRIAATKPTEAEAAHRQLARLLIEIGQRTDEGEVLTGNQGDEIIDAINLWRLLSEKHTARSNSH